MCRLLLLLWPLLFSLTVKAEPLTVTAYRPTVTNPAELSALHHFEVEFGAKLGQPGMQEGINNLPYLLKYPFHKNWGVLVGGDAWLEDRTPQESHQGFGNTSIRLKHYYPVDPTLALGFEAGAVLPSAPTVLGQGRTDYFGTLIVSKDFADLRIDANIGLTRQGYHEVGIDRHRFEWAVSASHPVTERWGILVGLSGVSAQKQQANVQLMGGFTYSLGPSILLDFGSTLGVAAATEHVSVFAGFAVLIPN